MTYQFGVWEGAPPLSNAHAASEYQRRTAHQGSNPPSPAIRAFLDALAAGHPEQDLNGGPGPWETASLDGCADGTSAFLPVRPDRVDEMTKVIESQAAQTGLVVFDPQRMAMVPSAVEVERASDFELPSAQELPLHLKALMVEAIEAEADMVGILEQLSTAFYVQWLASEDSLIVEAQGEDLLAPELRLSGEGQAQMQALGFQPADPNWVIQGTKDGGDVERMVEALTAVLGMVRALPIGEPMRLRTFPI